MIELERTYLARFLPPGLMGFPCKIMVDTYVPKESVHPKLRIRQIGDSYEITKKEPIDGDLSRFLEQTVVLRQEEFESLKKVDGKRVAKKRYYYPYKNLMAEIDVFQEDLMGLVLVDFEFKTNNEKDSFQIPDFCLVDVTQEPFCAGGRLCGKRYEDIEKDLERFGYKKL